MDVETERHYEMCYARLAEWRTTWQLTRMQLKNI